MVLRPSSNIILEQILQETLILAQTYRYYKQEWQERDLPFATRCTYETIFNKEFDISFYQPEKNNVPFGKHIKTRSRKKKKIYKKTKLAILQIK